MAAVEDDRFQIEALPQERLVEFQGLGDRELLWDRDRDDRGEVGIQERLRDPVRLVCDRADLRDLCERSRRPQDGNAVPARRSVDDREVVRQRLRCPATLLREFPDLAEAEQLAHSRGGHRERREQAAVAEDRTRGAPDLEREVFLHGALRVDRQPEEVRVELTLLLVTAAVDVGDDRAQAAICGCHPQRQRHRRLADTALAGDKYQASLQERRMHVDRNIAVTACRIPRGHCE